MQYYFIKLTINPGDKYVSFESDDSLELVLAEDQPIILISWIKASN